MSKDEELTEHQKLCARLARARRYHRLAVRWLFDVSRLASMYRETEAWRGECDESILTKVAQSDHKDAMKEVIHTRALIDRAAEKLKEYDESERHIQESK